VAGLELVPWSALRLRRSPVRPFAEENLEELFVRFSQEETTDLSE
jgi:hypothetical protein